MGSPVIQHERIAADGVALHVARAGEGRPVLLLHGFPENWRSWRSQIPALAAAGFSVLAPDLRGYNESDIPPDKHDYEIAHLVRDVEALVRATGAPRVHLVGHDWGGVVAWAVARDRPQLVDKLVIVNAPHPSLYLRRVKRPPQIFMSWYVLFFLLPWIPEFVLSAARFRVVRNIFERPPTKAGAYTVEEIDGYLRGLSRPGALTAALNYYRANARIQLTRWPDTPIQADTLVIWGERDPALSVGLLDGLDRLVPRLRVHRIPEASHWVHNEVPDAFNRVLTAFLAAPDANKTF